MTAAVESLRWQLWESGFRPIPLLTGQKHTLARGWAESARTDPPAGATTRATPDYLNTGILCDGLRVIDLDIDDAAVVASLGMIAADLLGAGLVRTRAGSPRRAILYRAAEGEPPKRVLAGQVGKVEVLGRGQQLHAFGRHPSGQAVEWPDGAPGVVKRGDLPAVTDSDIAAFLAAAAPLIGAADAGSPPAVADDDPPAPMPDESSLGPCADPLDVAAALAVIPNDGPADWEKWVRVGMATWAATGGRPAGFAAWNAWASGHPSYDAKATVERWRHFTASPPQKIGAGTLFHMARQARPDWRKPTEAAAPVPAPVTGGLRLLSPGACADAPGRAYIIKGLISERDVACIFGPPGAGKSVLAPHIGYAVAMGQRAFGRRTRQGGVFYVAAEDPHGMRQRVHGLMLTHGDAPGFAMVEGVGSLLDGAQAAALRELVDRHRPSLVFIDTLAMAFPGLQENDSADMGRVIAVARSLAETGAAVVLIHHDTKDQSGTPRGHSLFNGALDVSLMLGRVDDNGIIRGNLAKNRNGPCDGNLAFRIQSVALGVDEDGDDITAPVAAEVTGGQAAPVAKMARGTALALDVLKEMVALAGGKPVRESDWRAECCKNHRVSTSEDRDSRAKAFRRAFADLLDRGLVTEADECVGLVGAASDFPPIADELAALTR